MCVCVCVGAGGVQEEPRGITVIIARLRPGQVSQETDLANVIAHHT